jgi:hypothetical protein
MKGCHPELQTLSAKCEAVSGAGSTYELFQIETKEKGD